MNKDKFELALLENLAAMQRILPEDENSEEIFAGKSRAGVAIELIQDFIAIYRKFAPSTPTPEKWATDEDMQRAFEEGDISTAELLGYENPQTFTEWLSEYKQKNI